ncbi:pyridoxamine 5'-phosphate oxidase family protein [Candidatus Saccharibacteria bacterium]|nr:pyridoxamine 5'-phosphate oxidase family protein [Candidatus Saccharibacteria bacterium]
MKLTLEQLENIKSVGTLMLATASKDGVPHCTIVDRKEYVG